VTPELNHDLTAVHYIYQLVTTLKLFGSEAQLHVSSSDQCLMMVKDSFPVVVSLQRTLV